MRNIVMLASSLLIFFSYCFSQNGKSNFYAEGYGKLLNRDHVNMLSINTENNTDSFFHTLKKQLGSPSMEDDYLVYRCKKYKWSREQVVIHIQHALQTELDHKTSNTLFIYAETASGKDLLRPKTKSYQLVKDFFMKLYEQAIVNAERDDFK